MEAINQRVRELEETEAKLHLEWKDVLQRRIQGDEERHRWRTAEDDQWKQRFDDRDQQEDDLRRQRRDLLRSSMTLTTSSGNNPPTSNSGEPRTDHVLPTSSIHGVKDGNNEHASTSESSSSGKTFTSRAKQWNPEAEVNRTMPPFNELPLVTQKARKTKISHGFGWPDEFDEHNRPLYTRPSDGKLVYLHCCVIGCPKAHFSNVGSLRTHITRRNSHNLGKYYFRDHAQAIEVCGRLPMEQGGHDGGEEPPRAMTASSTPQRGDGGPKSPILISSLRRSIKAQRLDLNSQIERHSDVSYLDAGMNIPVAPIAQMVSTNTSTRSRLALGAEEVPREVNEESMERVSVPEYVARMRYDPDDEEERGAGRLIKRVRKSNGSTGPSHAGSETQVEAEVKTEDEEIQDAQSSPAADPSPVPLDHDAYNLSPATTADERAVSLPLFCAYSSSSNESLSELRDTAATPSIFRQFGPRPSDGQATGTEDYYQISPQHSSFNSEASITSSNKRASSMPLAMLDTSPHKRRSYGRYSSEIYF